MSTGFWFALLLGVLIGIGVGWLLGKVHANTKRPVI